jgi:hypothetical protein
MVKEEEPQTLHLIWKAVVLGSIEARTKLNLTVSFKNYGRVRFK